MVQQRQAACNVGAPKYAIFNIDDYYCKAMLAYNYK